MLDQCNQCNTVMGKEDLTNIDPGANESLVKAEYADFDGMLCDDCFSDMAK